MKTTDLFTLLRERVLQDLRNEGYTFEEIGQLFGISKQRADQIEKRVVRRRCPTPSPLSPKRTSWKVKGTRQRRIRVRPITLEEFTTRLGEINGLYEGRLKSILAGDYKARKSESIRDIETRATCLFGRVWPLIQSYKGRQFSLSKFVDDFPQLSDETYLPQMLCRLRRTGFLRPLGRVRVRGQCVPEILLAEVPVEHRAMREIEHIACVWSKKLLELAKYYKPTRPARSIEQIRRHIADKLIHDGCSTSEIDAIFPAPRTTQHSYESDSMPNRPELV